MSVKKTVLVIALLALSLCTLAATTFKLKHNVNASKNYYCEVWNPATNSSMSTAEITSGNRTVFATVMFFYNSNMKASISLSFTDLKDTTEGVTTYCPYTLEVLKPNTNEAYCTVVEDENGHGSGTAEVPQKTFTRYTSDPLDTDEYFDIAITIPNYSSLPAGDYRGNMTLTMTAN